MAAFGDLGGVGFKVSRQAGAHISCTYTWLSFMPKLTTGLWAYSFGGQRDHGYMCNSIHDRLKPAQA